MAWCLVTYKDKKYFYVIFTSSNDTVTCLHTLFGHNIFSAANISLWMGHSPPAEDYAFLVDRNRKEGAT